MYADIIVDISQEQLDKTFQYRIPPELENEVQIGVMVQIPFGRGNRLLTGYVIGIGSTPKIPAEKIKDIDSVSQSGIQAVGRMIQLAAWLKKQYGSTMNQALKTVLPVKEKVRQKEKRTVRLAVSKEKAAEYLALYEKKNAVARVRLLKALCKTDENGLDTAVLKEQYQITTQTIQALEKQNVITVETQELYRNPVRETAPGQERLILNEAQQKAVTQFCTQYDAGERKPWLLYGVTGSGKTLCYIEMIQHVTAQGKQAIVLIPEIALTYQTVTRFTKRFGERVSILNSRLSKGERYDQWLRAQRGDVDVIIGPRSALFVPFPNLGLIVIDEEHEGSYKSEQTPKYHAREVAIKKAQMEGASVILGSATPSVESYKHALDGTYRLWELTKRAKEAVLPQVYIEDLREELKAGNRSMFSRRLKELIKDRLNKGEQIMLFLNRRGYAGFVSCRSCGHVMECPHCDISMTYHRDGRLRCHYCGYEQPMLKVCPECGSPYIGTFGLGTQKVEAALYKEFPQAKVLRMDMDTTKRKNSHEQILSAFSDGEADILVGTQMIVKGHDFANVTLVGVLAADLSLHANDYRAGERTFQLLTQAAGRAGRGDKPGEVVIQTYSPEHYSIQTAAKQDYHAFYKEEISYRSLMRYPPEWQMLVVFASGEDKAWLDKVMDAMANVVKHMDLMVIGPSEAGFGKINDQYRKVIYIKNKDYETLVKAKNRLEQWIDLNKIRKNLLVNFDFNPMNSY